MSQWPSPLKEKSPQDVSVTLSRKELVAGQPGLACFPEKSGNHSEGGQAVQKRLGACEELRNHGEIDFAFRVGEVSDGNLKEQVVSYTFKHGPMSFALAKIMRVIKAS